MPQYPQIYRLLLFIWAVGASLTVFGQGAIKAIPIDPSKLPKGIKYNGTIKEAVRFTDRSGDHLIVTSETGIYRNKKVTHQNDGSDAELYAYHFIVKPDRIEEQWKVYDYI